MPKAKPTSKPLHRKNRRRRFHFEIPETRRLLAAQLDYGDAPDLGPGNAEGDEAKEQLEKAFEAGGTNNTSPSYIHYFLAMTEHHIGNADVAQEDLVRANESAEKELGGSPIGNRKLTIKSRRKEAKASIDTEGQANTKEDDNSMNNEPGSMTTGDVPPKHRVQYWTTLTPGGSLLAKWDEQNRTCMKRKHRAVRPSREAQSSPARTAPPGSQSAHPEGLFIERVPRRHND